MDLPLIPLVDHSQIYISGDVTVEKPSAIAPGTILQAAPNSRIIIRAGACIGMGSVIQSYQGTIEIQTGAILGAGVLVIGYGKIGSYACIGTATTIFEAEVAAQEIIPAGSVIGDSSRQVVVESEPEVPLPESAETSVPPEPPEPPELASPWESESEVSEDLESEPEPEYTPAKVYGHVHVNRLLLTIFPDQQSSNHPENNPPSP